MPPLPLLVASPSPGGPFDHAQLLPKVAGASNSLDESAQPVQPLEKFSELKRELSDANKAAAKLQAERDRLQAENTVLAQENDELRARQSGSADAEPAQEVKKLKKQLKDTKGQLAAVTSRLRSSQRTVAELRANASASEAPQAARKQQPPQRRRRAAQKAERTPRARAASEPPRRDGEPGSETETESESESEYSDSDDNDRDDDRGYTSRSFYSSDEASGSSDESDFDRPVSRRTRQRQRRRHDPQSAVFEDTLNFARQSLPFKEYEKVQQYTDHRRRIATISASVDTSPPREYPHMRVNVKRAQQEKERKEQQRKANLRMARRVREMQQQKPISHW